MTKRRAMTSERAGFRDGIFASAFSGNGKQVLKDLTAVIAQDMHCGRSRLYKTNSAKSAIEKHISFLFAAGV